MIIHRFVWLKTAPKIMTIFFNYLCLNKFEILEDLDVWKRLNIMSICFTLVSAKVLSRLVCSIFNRKVHFDKISITRKVSSSKFETFKKVDVFS